MPKILGRPWSWPMTLLPEEQARWSVGEGSSFLVKEEMHPDPGTLKLRKELST